MSAECKSQESHDVNDIVLLRISEIKTQRCKVVDKRQMPYKLGDSKMGYKLKYDDHSDRIHEEYDKEGKKTEWIAQDRLEGA